MIDASRIEGDIGMELVAEIDLATAETEVGELDLARVRLIRSLPRLQEAGLLHDEARALRLDAVIEAAQGRFDRWRAAIDELRGPEMQIQRDLLTIDMAQLDPTIDPPQIVGLHAASHPQGFDTERCWVSRGPANAISIGATVEERNNCADEVLASNRASAWARLVSHHVLGRMDEPGSTRHLFRAVHLADHLHGRLPALSDRSAFLRVRGTYTWISWQPFWSGTPHAIAAAPSTSSRVSARAGFSTRSSAGRISAMILRCVGGRSCGRAWPRC